MKRNPLYMFKSRNETGIYNIPVNSTVHILDGGDGKPRFLEIISKNGLTPSSTVGQFLDNPNLYIDLASEEEIPSELEKIELPGKTGWRILGRSPLFYGEIGDQAIDFSFCNIQGAQNGAIGDYSFAAGYNVQSGYLFSTAIGHYVKASNETEMVVGTWNKDKADNYDPNNDGIEDEVYPVNRIFTVGIGTSSSNTKNGLEIYQDGVLRAPNLTVDSIINGDKYTLATKEYVDLIDGGVM